MAPTSPPSPGKRGTHSFVGWARHRASLGVFGEKKTLLSQLHTEPHVIEPIA